MQGFELDVLASADAGRDVYTGPCVHRPGGVDVWTVQYAGCPPVVNLDCTGPRGFMQVSLEDARALSEALARVLAQLEDAN